QIIYEIGLAQLDSKQYSPAFESFQSLLKSSPQDSLRHASIYQSGLCLAFAEDYQNASFEFEALSKQQMADEYLRGQAAIWHGLCHFFQNDFERALHIFDHVSYSSLPASIKTEAQFRRITCLYPLQRLEKAKESASRFLNAHPSHTRAPEAQLLLGDIYFDTEDPLEALEAYKKVHPDFPDLYSEAQLSASDALLALNDVSEAKKLLENAISHIHSSALAGPLYLQRIDISQDDAERKNIIKKWIHDHGNNKEANLALPILERLDEKEEAIEKAYQSQQLTLASRLLLAKSLALGRNGQPHQAELSLLKIQETIPPASLPPECNAYLGLSLAKLGLPHGIELLEDFLANHPRNENVPIAYWGLGLVAFEKENFEEAESWFTLAKDSVFPFPYESEASLLQGISLHNQNRFEQGNATLNQLLANRSTPAKVKAKALNALAKGAARKEKRKTAIAYFQRSYALYPAFYNTAIEAYLESASLFAKIEDHEAAINTCQELLQRYEGLPPEERAKAVQIIEASTKSKRASLASLDE
ncbi:MAG: tetratricopeptide repeat protein, partial [Verrucomicrobiota bacterium]